MTPAQVAHIMALVDEYASAIVPGYLNGFADPHKFRAAVEAALRDAPQAEGSAQPQQAEHKWSSSPGALREGCNYMAPCGSVCRKCGEVHQCAARPSEPPKAPVEPVGEREQFEAAYRARYPTTVELEPHKFLRDDLGMYEDMRVEIAWAMWQAARSTKETT